MTLQPRPDRPAEPTACCPHDKPTTDPQVQALRDLIAAGMSQPDASRLLWDTGAACWWLLACPALIVAVAYVAALGVRW